MTADRSSYDAIVAGGGPAGAAVACRLAATGRSVLLFEKETGPRHKVCGEFLSGEARDGLAALGIDLAALGAVPISRVRLVHGHRIAESALPFAAAGVSRDRLDEALLLQARGAGVEVRRGAAVRAIDKAGDKAGATAWHVTAGDARETAPAVFLATGKHDLRSFKRTAAMRDGWIGFKIHIRLTTAQTEALRDAVELILFEGGYAGLQLVEPATANLCLVVRKSTFARVGKSWPALLDHLTGSCPHLADRLTGAQPCWEAPLAIASLPFGFLAMTEEHDCGLYRLGDQVSVIPAFSGNGIAIALHSARLAADCFLQGRDGADYLKRVRADLRGSMGVAASLSRVTAHGWAQSLMIDACCLFPPFMAALARNTRIAEVVPR